MRGQPLVLKCPQYIRSADREHRGGRNVQRLGVKGPKRGRFRRPTWKVRCCTCGHEWFSTHPDAAPPYEHPVSE